MSQSGLKTGAVANVADDSGCYVVAGLQSSSVQRLKALQSPDLLDPGAQQSLNELARLASLCCEVPVAMILLSDRHGKIFRQTDCTEITCRQYPLPFCAHAFMEQGNTMMIVPDARRDVRFAGNALVAAQPGMVFFAVTPLQAQTGETVGTLCIADNKVRELSELQRQMLTGLAAQIVQQLELRGHIMLLESKVASQLRFAEHLKREQLELQKQNATDPLTGLGNRRSFHDRLCLEIARAELTRTQAALIIFDVDSFKAYNDSFGHPAGDLVLKQLAEVVLSSCREEDFAARIGGEEFAVLLPGTTVDEAYSFARWLRRRVQRQSWPHRPVTISAGVAVAVPGEGSLQLAARADIALYRAKRDGRNRVTLSEPHPAH